MTKFPFFDDQTISITIEQIPDGLDLRQNQPALRSLLVNGNHEHRQLPSTDQITQNGRVVDELHRCNIEKCLPQVQYSLP